MHNPTRIRITNLVIAILMAATFVAVVSSHAHAEGSLAVNAWRSDDGSFHAESHWTYDGDDFAAHVYDTGRGHLVHNPCGNAFEVVTGADRGTCVGKMQ